MQSNSAIGNKGVLLFNRCLVALVVVLLTASFSHANLVGLFSAMIGLVGTTVFLGGTWMIVKLSGAASVGPPSSLIIGLTVVALLLKLPLIYVGWIVAKRLGSFGPMWFLIGLGLVYCLLIWRAALAVRD